MSSTNDKENAGDNFTQRVQSLRMELDEVQGVIARQLTALYSSLPPALASNGGINIKNDPRNALKIMRHDVMEMLQDSEKQGELRKRHAQDLLDCETLLETLRQVCFVGEQLTNCEEAIAGADIPAACKQLSSLQEATQALPSTATELGTGAVCQLLRKETSTLRHRFLARLKRLLRHCLQFDVGQLVVVKKLQGLVEGEDVLMDKGVALAEVWAALGHFGAANESVGGVMEDCWCFLLRPLWRERKGAQSPRVSLSEERAELVLEAVVREHQGGSGGGGGVGGGGVGGTDAGSGGGGSGGVGGLETAHALGACRMPLPALLEHVAAVVHFLLSEAFRDDNTDTSSAPHRFFASLHSPPMPLFAVLQDTLLSLMPKTEGELAAFIKMLDKPCREFEAKMASMSPSPSSSSSSSSFSSSSTSPLSNTLGDLTRRFAESRRREILNRARELVLADYHNTMLANGDASIDEPSSAGDVGDPRALLEQSSVLGLQALRFEPRQVSLASCRLLKLVHDVMKSAGTAASQQVARMLYQTARDCLELFIAVVPHRFADIISLSPRMGAVFFNDCLYLAHNCVLIAHTYRASASASANASGDSALNAGLLEMTGLLDFVPRLRSLGETCVSGHVEQQRAALTRLLEAVKINPIAEEGVGSSGGGGGLGAATRVGAGGLFSLARGLGRVSTSSGWNDEAAAAAIVRHLEGICGQWHGVLADGAYERTAGHLLECVLLQAMQPLLQADCISETAGADIARAFGSLQRARALFPSTDSDAEALSALIRCVPSWPRFLALSAVLEGSLADLADWLPSRRFAAFTGAEMSGLVKALFEDSPKRQAILDSIREMGLPSSS